MIRKRLQQFSEKIMRKQKACALLDHAEHDGADECKSGISGEDAQP
jgi:hypothetical protein